MNAMFENAFPRREFLKGAGALIVGFTLANISSIENRRRHASRRMSGEGTKSSK